MSEHRIKYAVKKGGSKTVEAGKTIEVKKPKKEDVKDVSSS